MSKQPARSADFVVSLVASSPALEKEVKADPVKTLRKLAEQATANLPTPALVSDEWIYRIVTGSLGIVVIAAMLGAIYLSSRSGAGIDVKIPDVLTALGSAAIGALAGILAPSPSGKSA